jgi:hypothetical protein
MKPWVVTMRECRNPFWHAAARFELQHGRPIVVMHQGRKVCTVRPLSIARRMSRAWDLAMRDAPSCFEGLAALRERDHLLRAQAALGA